MSAALPPTPDERHAAPTPHAGLSYHGGRVGVLLIHGFTGSPAEMAVLAEALAARGYSVEAPLLAGHGADQETLAATSWRAWVASAEAALRELQGRCDAVALVGFSMGGAIALHLAAREQVAGIVTIATPVTLDNPLLPLLPVARLVLPYWYPLRRIDLTSPGVMERLRTYAPDLRIDPTDRAQVAELKRSFRISLRAVYQLTRLLRATRAVLPRVTVPALLLQGTDDEQIPARSIDLLDRELGSPHKEIVRFARQGHMLPTGPVRDEVAARVVAFVERVTGPAHLSGE